jgi:CheY-like chemotaxis protein
MLSLALSTSPFAPPQACSAVAELIGSLRRCGARAARAPSRRQALIVGGDALQQRFCESVLQTLGVSVLLAPTCREALATLSDTHLDLVVVDEASAAREGDCWACLLDLLARMNRQHLYVIAEHDSGLRTPAWTQAARHVAKPIRAIDLVEATLRLPRPRVGTSALAV